VLTRRNLSLGLPLGFLFPSLILAQQAPKVIGLLSPYSSQATERNRDAFLRAMLDLGYTRGRDFVVVERFADGRNERLPELAEQLVKLKVDLIWASSTNAVAAARNATTSMPIVFESVADPVQAGFADSLARPGHNMTGFSNFAGDLNPKRLQLLKQMVPSLTRVAVLLNSTNPYYAAQVPRMQAAAEQLGLRAQIVSVSSTEELEPAFQSVASRRAQAVYISADAYFWAQRQQIAELALRYRLPSMFPFSEYVEVGGLMSYGADSMVGFRIVATYVDRIFKGAKPGDLSIEQPTRVELVINRKTADALHLTIPQVLLLQAERVIE